MNYEKMSEEDFVSYLIKNPELTPCLLVGKYVNAFKRTFDGTIERAYTLNNVRNLIDEYDGISSVNSGLLVIEGVGYLSATGQNSMLKFIEESKLSIVLLSYQDNVINTIRSRMKIFLKSVDPVKDFKYVSEHDCMDAILEKQSKDANFKDSLVIQYMANNCPKLYGRKEEAGNPYDSFNTKMINIFTKDLSKVKWE